MKIMSSSETGGGGCVITMCVFCVKVRLQSLWQFRIQTITHQLLKTYSSHCVHLKQRPDMAILIQQKATVTYKLYHAHATQK